MKNLIIILIVLISLNIFAENSTKEQGKGKEEFDICMLNCEYDFGKNFDYIKKIGCIIKCVENNEGE